MGKLFLVVACILTVPGMAHAYIGPGMGAGTIAAVLGVVASFFIGIFAVVYYPIKRALRRKRAVQDDKATQPGEDAP